MTLPQADYASSSAPKALHSRYAVKFTHPAIMPFHKTMRSYALFNALFFILGILEIFCALFFFTFLSSSFFLAVTLSVLFLTFFSYFVLRMYFDSKKGEILEEILQNHLESHKNLSGLSEKSAEYHRSAAKACINFAEALDGKETAFYLAPPWLNFLSPLLKSLSFWLHWEDVFKMKELLLKAAAAEYIELVKSSPTNSDAHTKLANAYIRLSGLYQDPARVKKKGFFYSLLAQKTFDELQEKFRKSAERAIEEFKILKDFSPEDPWVHTQLAFSYHDLQMPQEEIREYETVHALTPLDTDTLLKLGILYFRQGYNAKGLCMYEKLKNLNLQKAEILIEYYGSFNHL